MSFKITLSTNTSPPNKLEKTLINPADYQVTLKDECDILSPVFLLNEQMANVSRKNYLTIEAWGRSYFVTGITSKRNNLVQISAEVDVLSTYAEQIKAGSGLVVRSPDANRYIPDSARVLDARREYELVQFPNGFTGQSVILAAAGPGQAVT